MSALAWKDPYYFESALNCTQIKGEDAGDEGGFESPTKPESERTECIHRVETDQIAIKKRGEPRPSQSFRSDRVKGFLLDSVSLAYLRK